MPKIIVNITIEKGELLKYYAGSAKFVMAKSETGHSVRFPVEHLRPFVNHDGIQGRFCIEYSTDGKFQSIEKLN